MENEEAIRRFKKLGMIKDLALPKDFAIEIECGLWKPVETYLCRNPEILNDIVKWDTYGFHPTKLRIRGRKYIHEFWLLDYVLEDRYFARYFWGLIS